MARSLCETCKFVPEWEGPFKGFCKASGPKKAISRLSLIDGYIFLGNSIVHECLGYVKKGSGSGGTGTDNYEDLDNIPSINGHDLIGDKTAAQLDLLATKSLSTQVIESNFALDKNTKLLGIKPDNSQHVLLESAIYPGDVVQVEVGNTS
jgi:hypothetical protein